MDILFEIQRFLKKLGFADIILIGTTAYLIYKIIKRNKNKASFNLQQEQIKVVEEDKDREIIYDTNTGIYSLVKDFDVIHQSKDLEELKRYQRMEILRYRIEKLN